MKKLILILILVSTSVLLIYGQEAVYQKSVLALYKSSEGQTKEENEIYFYMSRILEEMGLKVVYWDIDRGIPGESVTRYHRAVISWFRGPSMRNAEAYLGFLEDMISQGKKVLVMDNLGAYQDRQTEEYVRPLRLNTTLSKLGIMYHGDWTQDGSLIEPAYIDSDMVEDQGKQNPEESAFFYHFIPSDRDMRTYMSIRRKDKEYAPSPIIVSNKNGGFALSRYIYRVEGGVVKLLVDIPAYLRAVLFPEPISQKVAILVNPAALGASEILQYTESAFNRAKIEYQILLPNSFRGLVPLDFAPFSSVAVILDSDSGLDPEVFEQYLKDGGSIVSLKSGNFNRLAPVLGIKETRSTVRENTGYRISKGFLTGENVEINDREYLWEPGKSVPVDNAEILGTSYNKREPLLWKTKIHNGQVLTWNWDLFSVGSLMGYIVDSILYIQPVGLAATPALSIMHLDDWPLPMYNVVREPFDIPDTQFYTEIWWPEIQDFLGKWDQPFSSYIVFNYNVTTEPPFQTGEFFVAENNASFEIAMDHFNKGIELGFHGYNHMSLTSKTSELNAFVWPSEENMELSVIMAREEWIRLFGEQNLPRSYVAPHNVISSEGIDALSRIFPSIKAICTLHTSVDIEEEAYEYGYNEEYPLIYMLPRLSSGYNFTEEIKMSIVSGINGPGLFSHFVHADDVYDPYRSKNKSWPELKEEFGKMMTFVRTNYPWLRPMNVYDGYRAMSEYDEQAVDFKIDGNVITVNTNSPGLIFKVRFEGKQITKVTGGTILYNYNSIDEAVIQSDSPNVVVELR